MDNNLENTTKFINETYDNLSYLDLYGGSVFLFLFITLLVFAVFSFCKIMQTKEAIAANWNTERCKPQNIPFAGFINKPDGKTAFQYTNENFQYCVQSILTNVTGFALEPVQFMLSSITNVFKGLMDSLQNIRDTFNKLRNNFKVFAEDILHRVLNIIVPLQQMIIAVVDSFQKIQGILTGSLYTMLGSYYTLKALLGAILEMIIKILLVMVIIIVGLWIMPFTWPAATAMTAVFLGLSVPLAIIVYFMSEVMHIQTSAIPKLRCFDKNTILKLVDGSQKKIEDIDVGDKLESSGEVTAVIKVAAKGLKMYNINGTIVSESHVIKYKGEWIFSNKHPDAKLIANYKEPFLYCLNTTSKKIIVNNLEYTDWDEIYDEYLECVLDYLDLNSRETNKIHKYSNKGFRGNALVSLQNSKKNISDVEIFDVTDKGSLVYGIVKMNNLGKDESEDFYSLLVSDGVYSVNGQIINDYNFGIDYIISKNFI
jgi:hypothetical protein